MGNVASHETEAARQATEQRESDDRADREARELLGQVDPRFIARALGIEAGVAEALESFAEDIEVAADAAESLGETEMHGSLYRLAERARCLAHVGHGDERRSRSRASDDAAEIARLRARVAELEGALTIASRATGGVN